MGKFLKLFFDLNFFWTIYLNFKYFRLKEAFKFPVLVHGRLYIHSLAGTIQLDTTVKTGMIRLGESRVGIFDGKNGTVLNLMGKLVFGGQAKIGRGSSISIGPSSKVTIGDNLIVTSSSSIIASGGHDIIIGKDCLISWNVLIINNDFHKLIDLNDGRILNQPANIEIQDKVWLGSGATVLKGANIPEGSIVAANSTCTIKYYDKFCVYAGTPAKKIKSNVSWEH